ncbi:MAG: hypothetical protein WA876_11260 [Candidatus Acidiferrales bacterium]
MAAATKIISFVSPPQVLTEAETVTQAELDELIEFRNLRAQLETRITGIEDSLKTRLETGAAVESGVHVASLKNSSRRNVAWKDVVLRLAERLGYEPEGYVSNILAHTMPTCTVSLEVH